MPDIEIDGLDTVDITKSSVEIEVGLDNAEVRYDTSALVDVDPHEYYLTSAGIYTGRMESEVPNWIADYVNNQLSTNSSIETNPIIDALLGRVSDTETGISQNLQSIQTQANSLNTLETSLVSRLDANEAAILELDTTKVTADEALTIATGLQVSTFGNDVDAYITSIATTYANANLAFASDYDLLVAQLNGVSVSLSDTREVVVKETTIWDGTGSPALGDLYEIGGVWYQYLGGSLGPNNDGWVETVAATNYSTAGSVATEFDTFVTSTYPDDIAAIQSQIDGNITSWFHTYDTEYTSADATYQSTETGVDLVKCDLVWHIDTMYVFLSEIDTQNIDLNLETYPSAGRWRAVTNLAPDVKNYPAGQWTTNEERNNHLGDLAYNLATGYAYRWVYEDLEDDPDQGLIYGWVLLTDTDITSVLAAAAKAQDTADGKRMVFYTATEPTNVVGENGYTVELATGDLWVPSTDVGIYIEGEVYAYVEGHSPLWVAVTRYTEAINMVQAELTDFVDNTYSPFVTDIQSQVDSKAESYYVETMPHPEGTNIDYAVWVGDLWKKPSDNTEYIYQLVGSNYEWVAVDVPDIVYDTIDTKKTIYTGTSEPTNPNTNDMWITASGTVGYDDEEIYVWNGSSWLKPTKYTDDTAANRTVRYFSQDTTPTAEGVGDIWMDTNLYYSAATGTTTTSTPTEYGKVFLISTASGTGSWSIIPNEDRESINSTAWAAYSSSLITDPDGNITGWEFADGSNTESFFKVHADNFQVANTTTGYTPFSISGTDIIFNGKVSFTNVTDVELPSNAGRFYDDMEYADSTALKNKWHKVNGNGTNYYLSGYHSSGAHSMGAGDSVDPDIWLEHEDLFTFDSDKLYRLSVKARHNGSDGVCYIGLVCYAYDGVTKLNTAGSDSYNNSHYIAASAQTLTDTFTEYVGYFKGVGTTGVGGVHSDMGNPAKLYSGTSFVKPMVIANYNGTTGYTYFDEVVIEEVDNYAESINNNTTTINGGKITTGTLFANSIGTEVLYDSTHWVGGVEQSATTYNMKIDLNNGYIHIR